MNDGDPKLLRRAAEIVQWSVDVRPHVTAEQFAETREVKRALYRAADLIARGYVGPVVPEGWKLVPLEPTHDMIQIAGVQLLPSYAGQVNHQHAYDIVSEADVTELYKAMLRAAQNPTKASNDQ